MPDTSAIVTGHTRGLGAAIADHLLAHNVRVLGVARRENEDLANRYGPLLTQVRLNLADASALLAWIRWEALGNFLRGADTALLVNNAGVLQPVGPLQSQDAAGVLMAVAVNVGAPLALSAAFVAATSGHRDRRILHISSGAGSSAYAGWSVYCATKAALDQHARAVALDRTPALRIASVAPGVIDTDMQTEIRAASEEDFPDRRRFEELKRDGQLRSPAEAGREVVELLVSNAFGRDTVTDLRQRGG
jgi:NAD(P)-dependent dehydrogenase (short-subunit alcohol dehydrogenase family)